MKTTDILKNNNQLDESIRFGIKEQRLVMKDAKNIKVGIEYEYHVNTDTVDGTSSEEREDEVHERAYELRDEALQHEREQWIAEFVELEFDSMNAGTVTDNLRRLRDVFNDNKQSFDYIKDNQDRYIDLLNKLDSNNDNDEYMEYLKNEDDSDYLFVKHYADEIYNIHRQIFFDKGIDIEYFNLDDESENLKYFSIFHNTIDFDGIYNELDIFYDYSSKFNESLDGSTTDEQYDSIILDTINEDYTIDDLYEYIDRINELRGDDGSWDEEIKYNIDGDGAWEEFGNEIFDDEIEGYLDEAYEEFGNTSNTHMSSIEEILQRDLEDYHNDIREVTTDPSVTDGVETITYPLELEDAFRLMDEMFEHIEEYGSTSSATGMHVNMSFKGMRMDKKNFNVLKLVMLIDEKHLLETFHGTRKYVDTMFQSISAQNLFKIASVKNSKELISLSASKLFSENIKHQTINFSNIDKEFDINERRIEFRIFGNRDYEKHPEVAKTQIKRTAYMMMAAFSPTFGNKEYLSALTKHLDALYEEQFNMSYVEFSKRIKRNGLDKLSIQNIGVDDFKVLLLVHYPEVFGDMRHKWISNNGYVKTEYNKQIRNVKTPLKKKRDFGDLNQHNILPLPR